MVAIAAGALLVGRTGPAFALRGVALRHLPAVAAPGVLGGLANFLFLVSSHHGMLTVSAVISSLYPAATVVLAVVVLRERVGRAQALGLGLCAAAVVLVAAG